MCIFNHTVSNVKVTVREVTVRESLHAKHWKNKQPVLSVSFTLYILNSTDGHRYPTSTFTDTCSTGGPNDVGCYGDHSITASPGSLRHLLMSADGKVKIATVKLNLWN